MQPKTGMSLVHMPYRASLDPISVQYGDVLPNSVAGPQANPLRDGAILLLRFRELLLCAEGFVAL